MSGDHTRRRLLTTASGLTSAALAGCFGSSDNNDTSGTGGHGGDGSDGVDGNDTDQLTAWPSFAYDFQNTGHHNETSGPEDDVEAAWSTEVDDVLQLTSFPVIEDGLVYWAGNTVYAVDTETGDVEWETDAKTGDNHGKLVHDGSLYLTGEDAISSFDATTGDTNWTLSLVPKTSPIPFDDSIYVIGEREPDDDDIYVEYPLYEIDPDSGEYESLLEVQIVIGENETLAYEFAGDLAIADGTLFFCEESRVHAVDLDTGDHVWTYEHEDDLPVNGASPVVADGRVYVLADHHRDADSENSLRAIDAETGEQQWRADNDSRGFSFSPAYVDGMLYQISGNELYAIDTETGDVQWAEWVSDLGRQLIATKSRLYAHQRGVLTAVDMETGQVEFKTELGDTDRFIYAVIFDETIYIVDDGRNENPTLYAFDAV